MIEIRKTLDIPRPIDEVFAHLTRPESIAEYVGPIRRIHRMTTEAVDVGTRLTVEAAFLGMRFNQRAECTSHEPPNRFEARSVGGRFYFEAGFALYPTETGTRVEGWGNASAPSLFKLAEPLLGFFIERQVDSDFQRLVTRLGAGSG